MHTFDLVIGDDLSSNSFNHSWTHNHAVYSECQIDFISFPRNIIVDECHLSNLCLAKFIDLGSDNRAIHVELQFTMAKHKRQTKKNPTRGSKPKLNSINQPLEYHKLLDESISAKCQIPVFRLVSCWSIQRVKQGTMEIVVTSLANRIDFQNWWRYYVNKSNLLTAHRDDSWVKASMVTREQSYVRVADRFGESMIDAIQKTSCN